MKILTSAVVYVILAVIVVLVVIAVGLWIATFFENFEVNCKNPFDAIADHAERTAEKVNAIIKEQEK